MIEAFGIADRDLASALLAEGFPRHDVAFWDGVIERIDQLGGNRETGVPIGYFLRVAGEPVGVVLTPARLSDGADRSSARLRINLSSWYVRDSERWRAAAMMLAVIKRHDAIFTDLTPTPDVARMLPALGFTRIADSNAVYVLPLAALRRGVSASVTVVGDSTGHGLPAVVGAHARIGCWPLTLTSGQKTTTLLLRYRTLRGLPAATVVYCCDKALLGAAFPTVARALLRRGVMALVADDHGIPGHTGLRLRRSGAKFARGATAADFGPAAIAIDYAGTELGIIDF